MAFESHAPKGYYSRVAVKLRQVPKYAEMSDQEIHCMVEMLTSVEEFRASYKCFQDIVEAPSEGLAIDASSDKELVDRTQLHPEQATGKIAERYEKICKFPVKLVLCVKPNRPSQEPPGSVVESSLHAALLVSDHLFEWDKSSLVIPRKTDLARQPALTTGILYESEWFTYIVRQRSKLEATISSPPDRIHDQEINLMFDLTTKKDDLVKSVLRVVVNYNQNKTYDQKKCNNQHFIGEVTKALGVKKLPAFGASLKQQLEQSKQQCSRALARAQLTNHVLLDEYICNIGEEKLRDLTVFDLEYLVGKYFHYHVEAWERSADPDQWCCQEAKCQLNNIEKQLEIKALSSQSSCALL